MDSTRSSVLAATPPSMPAEAPLASLPNLPGNRPPLVSIGMPVFNGELYVVAAIESLLAQTFADFELIVCDNASTDRTSDICLDYAARDARIRYVRNPRNLGAGPNFDMAFHQARGCYFQWAAHDDMFAPDYLAHTVAALEANPDAVLCTVGIVEIGPNDEALRRYVTPLDAATSDDPVRRFGCVIHTRHQAEDFFGLYRRTALLGTALIGSYSGSDRVLLAEVALRGRWVRLPEPLFLHREHPRRATRAVLLVDRRKANLWLDAALASRKRGTMFHVDLYRHYWRILSRNRLPRGQRLALARELVRWWLTEEHFVDVVRDVLQQFSPALLRWAKAAKHVVRGAKRAPPPGSLPTLKL
jgi:glycosyltransferase involved in cell wall biosynthesis